ncbi:DnaD domain protein [Lysinibacillus sp. FSL H8-0500]|uniref:DnaD domain protein n=1 Tax=Lysinibacillus sp. FSL H8-0500 TaxID=2921393 RepID=UPI003100B9DA
MAIYRVPKKGNFVVLDKGFLNDARLSWKAKGLLAYMLSLPDDWSFCIADLATRSKCGREATTNIVKELIQAGYLQKEQARTAKGKFDKVELFVFEAPSHAALPLTGKPSTALSPTDKPPLLTNQSLNNQLLKRNDNEQESLTVYQFYEQHGFGFRSAHITNQMHHWLTIFSEEVVIYAMKLAVENNVLRWRYVEKILQNWQAKQLKNMVEIQADRQQFQASKRGQRREVVPKWFDQRHQQQEEQPSTIDFAAERQKILAMLESVKEKSKSTIN